MTLAGIGRKGPVGDTQVGLLTAAGSSDCDLLCDARVAAGRVVTSRTKQTPLSLAGGYDSFTVTAHSFTGAQQSNCPRLHHSVSSALFLPSQLEIGLLVCILDGIMIRSTNISGKLVVAGPSLSFLTR